MYESEKNHHKTNIPKIALANSHEGKSFFMTECKTGPTYGNDHLYKFDGLAIAKSWEHPCIKGYEIKISRGDFLQDNKYCCYLPYCNEMYFVVPKGLIDKSEIPTEFGLIYYNSDTKELRTKKKAIYRNIDLSADLLMYIIMNKLDSDRMPFHSTKAEFFKAWNENKKLNHILGKSVGTAMAKEIQHYEERLQELEGRENALRQLKEIDGYLWDIQGKYISSDKSRVDVIKEILERPYPKEVERIKVNTENILRIIEGMEGKLET